MNRPYDPVEEVIIRIPVRDLPYNVVSCPICGGSGRNADGMFSIGGKVGGEVEIRSRPASKCATCDGSGLVEITAYKPKK